MRSAQQMNPKRRRRWIEGGTLMVVAISLGAVAIARVVSGEVYVAVVVAMFVSAFAGMGVVSSVKYPLPGEYTPRPRTGSK